MSKKETLMNMLGGASKGFGRGFSHGAGLGMRQQIENDRIELKKQRLERLYSERLQQPQATQTSTQQLSIGGDDLSSNIMEFVKRFGERKREKEMIAERGRLNNSLNLLSKISGGETDIAVKLVERNPNVFSPDLIDKLKAGDSDKKKQLMGIVSTVLNANDMRDSKGNFDINSIRDFMQEIAAVE